MPDEVVASVPSMMSEPGVSPAEDQPEPFVSEAAESQPPDHEPTQPTQPAQPAQNPPDNFEREIADQRLDIEVQRGFLTLEQRVRAAQAGLYQKHISDGKGEEEAAAITKSAVDAWAGNLAARYEAYIDAGVSPRDAEARVLRFALGGEAKQNNLASSSVRTPSGNTKAALAVIQKHGLTLRDIEVLETMGSPAEMERHAMLLKENRDMKARLEKLERGQVPAQKFSAGNGGGGTSDAALFKKAGSRASMTSAEMLRLKKLQDAGIFG